MIAFWVVAGVIAAAAAALVLARAARAGRESGVDPAQGVYQRQLLEIDQLADLGLIAEPERRGAHAEAARRLLGSAAAAEPVWGPGDAAPRAVLITALAASLGALVLYLAVGRPGMPDQPFAQRLVAWRKAAPETLAPPELAAVLGRIVRERPNDPLAFRYLAIARSAAQDPAGAVRAMRQSVRLAPAKAEGWELLGEAELAAAGGEVSPEAEHAFREALKRDPTSAVARFHLARAQIARGDRAGGLAGWRALMSELPSDDPRRGELARAIAEASSGPQAPPGGQIEMIRGMVAGLAERLKARPDDPQGWVRLVRAYAVLGETGQRDAALATARARYAGRGDVLADLDAAAKAEPMR